MNPTTSLGPVNPADSALTINEKTRLQDQESDLGINLEPPPGGGNTSPSDGDGGGVKKGEEGKGRGGTGGRGREKGMVSEGGGHGPEQLTLPGFRPGSESKRRVRPQHPGTELWNVTDRLLRLWADRSGRAESEAKVTPWKLKQVRDRLAEGYTFEQLAMAVAGVCYDEFLRREGKDHFEVALIHSGQVDKGISRWLQNAPIEKVAAYAERGGWCPPGVQDAVEAYADQEADDRRAASQYQRVLEEAARRRRAQEEEAERRAVEEESWREFGKQESQGRVDSGQGASGVSGKKGLASEKGDGGAAPPPR